jgi:fatty-acyl-CoA synthase
VTTAELFLRLADHDGPGAHFEDRTYSYREVVGESLRRAALWEAMRDPPAPPHIRVLLDNTPEYLFWLGAAAISGAVVVGVNATYRGAELARLVDHCECQVLVTADAHEDILAAAPVALPADRVLRTHTDAYRAAVADADGDRSWPTPSDDDLYLLIFTSGSTGFPKAVRCSQGRFARSGLHVAKVAGLGPGSVVYSPLPFFHTAALFTGLSSALNASVPIGTRSRFSASRAMADVRRMGATMLTYTGKVLNYILAQPPSADDATSPLELAIGNEASEADIRGFAARFRCQVRDSYGSTEGMIIIRRDASMPRGALGRGDDHVKVLDPETGRECPPAVFDERGRLVNGEDAIGEIVSTAPGGAFEGYYRNEDAVAAKLRDGIYWSGDLAYRDADGWFFFAGRSNEWLRVDGENFAAGPVEAIVMRCPHVRSAAVYAVPDDPVGDRVMVAVEVDDLARFDVHEFDRFVRGQPDLGPKWVPAFVWPTAEIPKLSSMKVDKRSLRAAAWRASGTWWRTDRAGPLRPLGADDRARLAPLLDRLSGPAAG